MFEELPDKGAQFLRLWSRIKEEKTGKKTRIKKLGEKEEKFLRKFLKAKYTMEDFEEAIKALFNDPGQYAVKNGLDIPLHLFRNFERYLETAESLKEREAKQKEPEKEAAGDFLNRDEWGRACWEEYAKSLKAGEWVGTFAHSIPISKKLAESIDPDTKKRLWEEAIKEREGLKEKANEFKTASQIAEFYLKTAVNIYGEKIVKQAVKQEVTPWKCK